MHNVNVAELQGIEPGFCMVVRDSKVIYVGPIGKGLKMHLAGSTMMLSPPDYENFSQFVANKRAPN